MKPLVTILVFLLFVPLIGRAVDAEAQNNVAVREIQLVFGARSPAAIRVARCESRLNPRAVSRTGDYGLFQANYSAHHWRGESTASFAARHFNIRYHVRWAYRLSRSGTYWFPWARVCRP